MSMLRKFKASLTLKLNLLVLLICGLVFVFTALTLYKVFEQQSHAQAQSHSQTIINSLVVASQSELSQNNLIRAVSTLAASNQIQHLTLVRYGDGQIIADNKHQFIDQNYQTALSSIEQKLLSEHMSKPDNRNSSFLAEKTFYQVVDLNLINPKVNRVQRHAVLLSYD